MISQKQCHALKFCRAEWRHDYDRASGVGLSFIRQLANLGFVEFGTPPGWEGECYTATDVGRVAIREYEDDFGPVLKD
jgi:hypothetical protein